MERRIWVTYALLLSQGESWIHQPIPSSSNVHVATYLPSSTRGLDFIQRKRRRRPCGVCLQSVTDDDIPMEDSDEEKEDDYTPVDDVFGLRNVIDSTAKQMSSNRKQADKSQQPLSLEALSELEEVIAAKSEALNIDFENLIDDDDGIFLDEETYLKVSQEGLEIAEDVDVTNQNLYRSTFPEELLQELVTSPDAPYNDMANGTDATEVSNADISRSDDTESEPTLEDVIALRDQLQRNPQQLSKEEEEEIYQEVFRNEGAYLEQTSELFQRGLTNRTAALEATLLRRSARYREELSRQVNKLEDSIQELEELLATEQITGNDNSIASTDADNEDFVVDEENSFSDDDPIDENASDSDWVLVEDPTTGETFYWNEESEEMRWDL